MARGRLPDWTPLALIITVGSVGDAWRYVGWAGIPLAIGWGAVAAMALYRVAVHVTWSSLRAGLLLLAAVALTAFAYAYPRLDVNTAAAGGSDRDDDADVAVRAALRGEFPFEERTYLGNRITHMPGSLIVAAPFVIAGGSALENVVVLPLAVVALVRRVRSPRLVALTVGGAAACANVWHEWLTGGNSLAEWALLTVAVVWLLGARNNGSRIRRALAVGVALTARANVLTAAGVPIAAVHRRVGARAALAVAATTFAVIAALTAPFVLGGLERYSPLSSGVDKFTHLAHLFPHAATAVPIVATAIGAIAGVVYTARRPTISGTLAGLAITQSMQFTVLMAASAAAGDAYWTREWSGYLALAVIPGLAALALGAASSPNWSPKADLNR